MRDSWDEYFLEMANHVSKRATCDRLHVGCVLVRDKCVISTGYNGSISGMAHCDDIGHDFVDGHCIRTAHAEQNAICQAAKNGHSTDGCTAYITHSPCWTCFKLLVQCGVKGIIYENEYKMDSRIINTCLLLGIIMEEKCSSSVKE